MFPFEIISISSALTLTYDVRLDGSTPNAAVTSLPALLTLSVILFDNCSISDFEP